MDGLTLDAIVEYAKNNVSPKYAERVKLLLERKRDKKISESEYDVEMARLTARLIIEQKPIKRPFPTSKEVGDYCKVQAWKEINRRKVFKPMAEITELWLQSPERRAEALHDGDWEFKVWYAPIEQRIESIVKTGNALRWTNDSEDRRLIDGMVNSGDITIGVLSKEVEDGKVPWLPSTLQSKYRHIVESWWTWKSTMGFEPYVRGIK